MNEPKRPIRRGRTKSPESIENSVDTNPYRDAPEAGAATQSSPTPKAESPPRSGDDESRARGSRDEAEPADGSVRPGRPRRGRPPRGARLNGDEPAGEPHTERSPERPVERSVERAERHERVDRAERPELRLESNGPLSIDRPERDTRNDSSDLNARLERLDRMDRIERGESVDRADRTDRPERNDPADRNDRGPRQNFDRQGRPDRPDRGPRHERGGRHLPPRGERPPRDDRAAFVPPDRGGERIDRSDIQGDRSGLRGNARRGRNRFRRGGPPTDGAAAEPRLERAPSVPTVAEGTISGWFDASRDGGFLRRAINSYLPDPGDPFVSPALVRLHQLRRGDKLDVTYGRDHRGRHVVIEIQQLNDGSAVVLEKRPDFNTLTASYPDRKLTLETGRPAKSGPELTRRAIDLIAPIGYGQRALIVAPARAGKTTLLQAIVEGVAINHPEAVLIVLLVDERPEEVSEMVTWGYGEVVASSFDMPPKRHVEVADMALERARRQVEMGKDVVIVLDSITRLARAHNTVERGTGRTMSGGLDSNAMQKPKAFFGSARMIAPEHGGGSLTIISTALVETGSRMDDVIFEEFKGTGNCEIKLDRSLADRRIFPAFDIATSGTRREEKLYRPDQLEKVHLLRRGLHQLPPQAGMEWLIKRIAGTSNNDSLLDGL